MKYNFRDEVSNLSKEQMVDLLQFMADSWWNLQNTWMVNISKEFGTEVAAKFDGLVFSRCAQVQARRLQKLFGLGDDIPALIEANKLSPLWSFVDMEILDQTEKSVRFLVTKCQMQLNRLEAGLPELPCKQPGIDVLGGFGKTVNPKIKMTCLLCPPDEHPDDAWCEWLYELEED